MPLHQLHLVTEPRRDPKELVRVVARALASGVDWVQLRNKLASAAAMYAEAITRVFGLEETEQKTDGKVEPFRAKPRPAPSSGRQR